MLHGHLQDVRLLQLGVSGALKGKKNVYVSTLSAHLAVGSALSGVEMWSVVPLTSFLSASMMRVFSCPRLSLMRARLRFSMMGLEDLKYKREKTNEMTVWFGIFFYLCGTFGFIHNLPFCSLTECGVFRVWSPHLQVLHPQRVEMFSQKYRPAFSFFVFKKLNSSPNKP